MIKKLGELLLPYKPDILLTCFLGFSTISSGILLLSTSAWLISTAALQPSIAILQLAIVGVRFFGLSRGSFRYLERYFSHALTFKLLSLLKVNFYKSIEPVSPIELNKLQKADLLTRIVADIDSMELFYIRTIYPPIVAALILTVSSICFAYLVPMLAWLNIIIFVCVGIIFPLILFFVSKNTQTSMVNTRKELSENISTTIYGLPEITIYNATATFAAKISRLAKKNTRNNLRMALNLGMQNGVFILAQHIFVVLALIILIPLVNLQLINGVMLAVVTLGLMAIFEAYQPLCMAAQSWQQNLTASQRVFSFSPNIGSEISSDSEKSINYIENFNLEFKDVTFKYPLRNNSVLKDLSFTLPAGQKLLLTGPSGCGKTTLTLLLQNFCQPSHGEIRIDGHNINLLTTQLLTNLITIISPTCHIFCSTLRDNLLLAKPTASAKEISQALHLANLTEFVAALPSGINTFVGEKGTSISGGEKQKILLARAILKNSPLIVFDEAFSSLDFLSEKTIQANIQEFLQNKSAIIISHRPVKWMNYNMHLELPFWETAL